MHLDMRRLGAPTSSHLEVFEASGATCGCSVEDALISPIHVHSLVKLQLHGRELPNALIQSPMSTETPHFFSADRPIQHLDEDRLQRASFARSIARAIMSWHGAESLVIALYGGWGDGKSSVKGMVIDAMEQDTVNRPFVVHFNPWEWAGQNQLAQVFFDEIGKQIAHQGSGKAKAKAQECGRRLQKLGKYLNLTGSFMAPLGYAANLVVPFASDVTRAAGKAFKQSGELASQAAEMVKERDGVDLIELKTELRGALTKLNRNVVVLVDDVDRLAAEETKLSFQLIKANSDFPNLVFFLFFQRDIIEAALEQTVRTGSGKDYLEKIVQVLLSLPAIQRPLLTDLVHARLKDLLARRGLENGFEWRRFGDLLKDALSPFFQNLRDVERFFGTFEFQIASFPSPAEFNGVDLFALEVLRVFESGVHQALSQARHLVESDPGVEFHHEPRRLNVSESWQSSIKQIAETGKASRQTKVETVLKALFPIQTFPLRSLPTEAMSRMQKDARVCHPAFFGRYFHLCLPQGDVPQTEMLELVASIGSPEQLRSVLDRLDKRHLALEALRRLTAYSDEFEASNFSSVISVLFDEGDRFLGRYSGHFFEGFPATAYRLIEAHLEKLADASARFTELKPAFQSTNGVYLPGYVLNREKLRVADHDKNHAPLGISREQRGVLSDEHLNELTQICVRKFEGAAAADSFQTHRGLPDILVWWLRWSSSSSAVKDFFRRMVQSHDGLLRLLEHYLGRKLDQEGQAVMYEVGLTDFEQFMPVDEVKAKVDELPKADLSARNTSLCRVFLETYREYVINRRTFAQTTTEVPQKESNPETGSA
jgi:predicted KAP-like P-loop ATPase